MQAIQHRNELLERRHAEQDISNLWDKLTLAQKFAASSLLQFGYHLKYLRNSQQGTTAILLCETNIATISSAGEIDTSPNINIRQ